MLPLFFYADSKSFSLFNEGHKRVANNYMHGIFHRHENVAECFCMQGLDISQGACSCTVHIPILRNFSPCSCLRTVWALQWHSSVNAVLRMLCCCCDCLPTLIIFLKNLIISKVLLKNVKNGTLLGFINWIDIFVT